jgi:hypothetical protein
MTTRVFPPVKRKGEVLFDENYRGNNLVVGGPYISGSDDKRVRFVALQPTDLALQPSTVIPLNHIVLGTGSNALAGTTNTVIDSVDNITGVTSLTSTKLFSNQFFSLGNGAGALTVTAVTINLASTRVNCTTDFSVGGVSTLNAITAQGIISSAVLGGVHTSYTGAGWISLSATSNAADSNVVMGAFVNPSALQIQATIGAHNGAFSAWQGLCINPSAITVFGNASFTNAVVSQANQIYVAGPAEVSGNFRCPTLAINGKALTTGRAYTIKISPPDFAISAVSLIRRADFLSDTTMTSNNFTGNCVITAPANTVLIFAIEVRDSLNVVISSTGAVSLTSGASAVTLVYPINSVVVSASTTTYCTVFVNVTVVSLGSVNLSAISLVSTL